MTPAVIAYVLITGFARPGGANSTIVVSALYDQSECHRIALEIGAKNHKCIEYRMAVPEIDAVAHAVTIADAIQDAQQDGIIR
jgi:hypothetical protein